MAESFSVGVRELKVPVRESGDGADHVGEHPAVEAMVLGGGKAEEFVLAEDVGQVVATTGPSSRPPPGRIQCPLTRTDSVLSAHGGAAITTARRLLRRRGAPDLPDDQGPTSRDAPQKARPARRSTVGEWCGLVVGRPEKAP